MAIVVGENSYNTEAELVEYATARGLTISGDTEQLLIKAMDWLEFQPFIGVKYVSTQDLEFPRYPSSDVPAKIKKAQLVAAMLIDSGEVLFPVVDRATKREKIDVLEVEYMENASETKRFPELSLLLREFLTGSLSFMVSRG